MKKVIFSIILVLNVTLLSYGQIYKDPGASVDARVEDLLSRMSLEEKVGQMTQGNMPEVSTQEVTSYFIGSVLSGGGSTPSNNTPAGWADLVDGYQTAALATPLGIPIIYGIDAVHGHNNVKDAVIFPHNIGLGAANDPVLTEEIGRITALEVATTGVDWTFSPCVAVARDERWGRTYESFSENPGLHNHLTASYVKGYQGGDRSMGGERIVACAKHWIGDGGTAYGTGKSGILNEGDTQCDEQTLRELHLPPYIEAIEAGVGTIMTSFTSWNGETLTGHQWLNTTVLKEELGFEGFIVSDWNSIRFIPGSYRTQIKTAINSGVDMAMAPYRADWQPFISNLKDLVQSGEVSMSRIDDAVRRILKIKFEAGLFENPFTDRSLADKLGSQEHRDVARDAVRKSLVLLKNENNVLPLSKTARIFVAGKNSDSVRNQCGGWTIHWQGMESNSETTGTNIYNAFRAVSNNILFSKSGNGAAGNDVAVVVVGESPYAETEGDRTDLHLDSYDQQAIANIKAAGMPYVIVLISGRPMVMTDEIADADAVVAAWLPGTEGQGIADVLFGDYDFTGTLPHSWPKTMSQIPINYGDSVYDPLYPLGYGLSYNGLLPSPDPATGIAPTPTPAPPEWDMGDVNHNGSVDIVDALLIAQHSVQMPVSPFFPALGDVNNDGSIDIVDALLVARFSAGLITSF